VLSKYSLQFIAVSKLVQSILITLAAISNFTAIVFRHYQGTLTPSSYDTRCLKKPTLNLHSNLNCNYFDNFWHAKSATFQRLKSLADRNVYKFHKSTQRATTSITTKITNYNKIVYSASYRTGQQCRTLKKLP